MAKIKQNAKDRIQDLIQIANERADGDFNCYFKILKWGEDESGDFAAVQYCSTENADVEQTVDEAAKIRAIKSITLHPHKGENEDIKNIFIVQWPDRDGNAVFPSIITCPRDLTSVFHAGM